MTKYCVFDTYNLKYIGNVEASTAKAAIRAAKIKFDELSPAVQAADEVDPNNRARREWPSVVQRLYGHRRPANA